MYKIFLLILLCINFSCNSEEKSDKFEDALPDSFGIKELALCDSISQHGITWTFDEKVPIGQFVNGDYYIVGPVTVIDINPKPENGRHGSVLNPPPLADKSGFDNRVQGKRYDPNLRVEVPFEMKPGDVLVSSISVDKVSANSRPLYPSKKARSPVASVSILTCLEKPVPPDAFRPSYCRPITGEYRFGKFIEKPSPGRFKEWFNHSDKSLIPKIYLVRNLRKEFLLELSPVKTVPNIREWALMFQKPWLDICFFGFDAPIEYMPDYGREIGRAAGIASLLLMLDFTPEEKEELLINFVQYGIDLWGIVEAGHRGWPGFGGHGHGRKWSIIFAGIMLGDKEMQSPEKKYPNLSFSEDVQTMYDSSWTGANVVYAGHIGKGGNDYKEGWGAYEHLPPSQWVNNTGENYRRCCTSLAWVGQALAARIMGAEKLWNHNAFFDYVDRWMTEDDSKNLEEIKKAKGWDFNKKWSRQGQAWDPFVNEMWERYRYNLPSNSLSKE